MNNLYIFKQFLSPFIALFEALEYISTENSSLHPKGARHYEKKVRSTFYEIIFVSGLSKAAQIPPLRTARECNL